MGMKLLIYVGYDSKSYELLRKIRLYDKITFLDTNIIYIPSIDDDILTNILIPSMIIEEHIEGTVYRHQVNSLSELHNHPIINAELGLSTNSKDVSHVGI